MVRAAYQQRWSERKQLLDGENYRLRREHVHAHHGEIGATHFSVTPNDSRTPPPATCLRLTIIIQLHRVTCKDERDASLVSSSCRLISLFSRFDLTKEMSGRLANEDFVHSEISFRIDALARNDKGSRRREKKKKIPLRFSTNRTSKN